MGDWFVVITDPYGVDGIVGPYASDAAARAAWRGVIYPSRHPEARASYRQPMRRITHGRHCVCMPCRVQDWTDPALAPCGMHGAACPSEYAPLGPAGALDPAETPGGQHG